MVLQAPVITSLVYPGTNRTLHSGVSMGGLRAMTPIHTMDTPIAPHLTFNCAQ